MKEKKIYVLMVSTVFPKKHRRAGDLTEFRELIEDGSKIHTIRANYDLWAKRIDAVNRGKAIISIRSWKGQPYKSGQIEWFQMEQAGIQKLQEYHYGWLIDGVDTFLTTRTLAQNDGLSFNDFVDWFKDSDWSKPMAIIHFTPFRYNTSRTI